MTPARAFTLIELLAVIALVAVASAVGVGGLLGASRAASLSEAASALRSADAGARLHARTSGTRVLLAPDSDTASITLHAASGERLSHRALPRGVRIHLERSEDRTPLDGVWIDASGRCVDYTAIVHHGDAVLSLRASGPTGWISEQHAERRP